jgi:serine protease inhibitor
MPPESLLRPIFTLAVTSICCSAVSAQQPKDVLQLLLQGNDKFGAQLLAQAHSETPDKNIVLAPLSLTFLLGAIQTRTEREESREEFDQVFGWGTYPVLRIPARMMLAAMEEPRIEHESPNNMLLGKSGSLGMVETESLWMTNRLLYRSPKTGPPPLDSRFKEIASRDFGLKLVNTGNMNPSESALRASRQQVGRVPEVSSRDDVWLSAGFHMRQSWENLFNGSQPAPGEFRVESGQTRKVLNIESELSKLPHMKTSEFEAVAIPCGRVQMVAVLPTSGVKIEELEKWLVAHTDALNGMNTSQLGSVTIPQFEIKTSVRLEKSLQAMGITDIFQHLDGIMPAGQSRIGDIAQNIDFGVDKHGIHADAETMIGAVYFGIPFAQDTFLVSLDRPFLFFVRDVTTNALVLTGALMDPDDSAR